MEVKFSNGAEGFEITPSRYIAKSYLYPGIYCLSVCPSVHSFFRSSVTLTKITSKFCVKVSQMGISQQPSESIHTWAMGTLEGLLTFHKCWPQGWGWRSKTRTHYKSVILLFLLCLPLLKTLGQTPIIHMTQPVMS